MRNLCFYFLSIGLLLTGCASTNELSDATTVSFNSQEEVKNISDTNIIKDAEVISLDSKGIVIGTIAKVIRYRSLIYLMDQKQNKCVYIFDVKGKYIRTISRYGQGADEYLLLSDIFIDSKDMTLNLVSRPDKKILKYNLNGSKLISVLKLPKRFAYMSKTAYGYIGCMDNYIEDKDQPFNLWLLDNHLKINSCSIDLSKALVKWSTGSVFPLSSYKNDNYCIMPMDNHIYLDNGDAKYYLDFGKLNLPNVSAQDLKNETKTFQLHNDYIFQFYNFQETNNYLFVRFLYQGQNLLGVYDKINKSSSIVKLDVYKKKYFFSFGKVVGFDNHTIYSIVEAEDMYKFWKGKDEINDFMSLYPTQILNLQKKFKSVEADGNPFLVMYTIN